MTSSQTDLERLSAASGPAPGADSTADPAAPRRGSAGLMIGLTIVSLLVFGGVAAGGWLLLGRGNSNSPRQPQAAKHQAQLPEPAAPPADFNPVLASATATASEGEPSPLETIVARLPAAATAVQQRAAAAGGGLAAAGATTGDRSQIPRHERWEIQFPPGNTIDTYSRQMDYFKIELGVVGGSDEIVYLANLTDALPQKRTGKAAAEKRLYLVWARGAMREADEELARRSQVPIEGRIVAHFCPENVESQMAQIEEGYASQKGITKIRKTIFGIQSNDFGGFRFYVIDQKADQG